MEREIKFRIWQKKFFGIKNCPRKCRYVNAIELIKVLEDLMILAKCKDCSNKFFISVFYGKRAIPYSYWRYKLCKKQEKILKKYEEFKNSNRSARS